MLPEVSSDKDACVDRIISALSTRRGIEKVHITQENDDSSSQLCFHYQPSQITIAEIEKMAKKAGAEIAERYGHLLVETTGVWKPRHARLLETKIGGKAGIISVSVSGTGFIQLEFDRTITTEATLKQSLIKQGLKLKAVEDFDSNLENEVHVHQDEVHQHGGIFGERTELVFAIICGSLLIIGFILSFVPTIDFVVSLGFYLGAYFFGGFYTTREAVENILKGKFEIDFLMLVAAVGAAILGEWAEGALLLFLFSLGHALEHYAMGKARKSIKALTDLSPKVAFLKEGSLIKEVKIESLKPGDIIVVKPNSIIAADGVVMKGRSIVNQAPITGESVPVDKEALEGQEVDLLKVDLLEEKFRVFSGTINGGQVLEIMVSKLSADSTLSRLIKLVNEAQTQKSATQNFTVKIEKYYVPAVLIMVVILLFAFLILDENFGASFYRAMAVLVAASPCALAISTPSAVLSGVARAARGGVLIKGGKPLEDLGVVKAIAFDKTGTLTEGKPKLTGIYPLNGITEEELLPIIIAVEKLSDHPLAAAIVKGASLKVKIDVPHATNVEGLIGRGVKALYQNKLVYIGNRALFIEKNKGLAEEIQNQVEAYEEEGNTTMLVEQDDQFIGIITLMDVAREDAKETLAKLKQQGIQRMIMLTGDNQRVAESIAKEIGITDAWGGLMPEQKVEAIDRLLAENKKVAMVGDGVNDAPAMAKSTVGIAMGAAGSDVALETADIALMADKLSNLPFAIGLSKKARSIIKQNLIISMGMVVVLVPLTLLGYASMGPAIIGHEGSTLIVVFNALRLLAYK